MLTDMQNQRDLVYCHRFQYQRSSLALAIITQLPWHEVFDEILKAMVYQYINSNLNPTTITSMFKDIQGQLEESPADLDLSHLTQDLSPQLRLPTFLPTDRPYGLLSTVPSGLLRRLSLKNLSLCLSALLEESRVIFVSKSLKILSRSIMDALALIYPLKWQFVLVPILPSSLITYCSAPMPFIIGLHTDSLNLLHDIPMEEDFRLCL
uniref:UDENN domain-containing protein n=1 Tax=Arcella intermedia TaxID=1963864 RepID=A0A6B2LJG4_9EUKA